MMRFRVLAPLALVLAALANSADAVDTGDTAPPWSGSDYDGRVINFPAALDGKPAVVVFWATWCPYCKAFMPYLERIQTEYDTERISIIMVNAMEDGAEDPRAYIDELDFPLIAVRDADAIAAAYGVEFIPGLMVIDADGTVAYRRAVTQLPAGSAVASLWFSQIRSVLRRLLE